MGIRSQARVVIVGLLLIFTLSVRTSPAALTLPTPQEQTGRFTGLPELDTFLHTLEKQSKWKMTVSSPTRSSRQRLPIWQVRLSPPSPRLRVMILARVHGNEPATTEAALALIRDLAFSSGGDADIYRNFDFLIMPCLNPEGADEAQKLADASNGWWGHDGRENDLHDDINRDYMRLQTSEARTAVEAYDEFHPEVVVDLHEYESRPLVGSGSGWWRAEYWDFMIGAGRAPWAAPALRTYCRQMTEGKLFPALKAAHLRPEHYMLPSGTSDSSMHFASNAADYFLVRGSASFLFESAGSDLGTTNVATRIHSHLVALRALLESLAQDPGGLLAAREKGRQESAGMKQVALSVIPKPRTVSLRGTDGLGFGFDSKLDLGSSTYHTHAVARFEGLDYDVKDSATLPAAYLLQTQDPDYLRVLLLHGLSLSTSETEFTVGGTRFPVGTVVVSTSPMAGLLLMKEVQRVSTHHLPSSGLVYTAPDGFTPPPGKPMTRRSEDPDWWKVPAHQSPSE